MKSLLWGFLHLFFQLSAVQANVFTSETLQFSLPKYWECQLEGTEWVCQSTNKDRKREAIVILATKYRGADDSLDKYQSYLKKKKILSLPGGKTQVSEAKYSKASKINNHRWIDSLHYASEVPGFYTRYLASVKEDLGVAVTFSVSKEHYHSYQKRISNLVKSLKVFKVASRDKMKLVVKGESEEIDLSGMVFDVGRRRGDYRNQKDKEKGSNWPLAALVLVLVGGGVYLVRRRG